MTQVRILHVIIKYTYGYHRSWHPLSLTFLAEATGCIKRQVTRELTKLIEDKVVLARFEDGERLLRINPKVPY